MSSWKHTFKAHQVAAKMGNIEDNFVYHRDQQSFPRPMARSQAQPRGGALGARLQGLGRRILPGGSQGGLGIAIGAALPFVGLFVIYSMVSSSANDAATQFAEVQAVWQQQREQEAQAAAQAARRSGGTASV
eukprot:TRINITY_DN21602_c0_g7_i1.p2 TRINITY_DN21602_c0_g7~~TRINITY_DN21602_c0_g7_i1.p2  ORF type:complete len:132 (-),score=29.83 TRINITY_DN21602_c0_g7_i1:21-416(-)